MCPVAHLPPSSFARWQNAVDPLVMWTVLSFSVSRRAFFFVSSTSRFTSHHSSHSTQTLIPPRSPHPYLLFTSFAHSTPPVPMTTASSKLFDILELTSHIATSLTQHDLATFAASSLNPSSQHSTHISGTPSPSNATTRPQSSNPPRGEEVSRGTVILSGFCELSVFIPLPL